MIEVFQLQFVRKIFMKRMNDQIFDFCLGKEKFQKLQEKLSEPFIVYISFQFVESRLLPSMLIKAADIKDITVDSFQYQIMLVREMKKRRVRLILNNKRIIFGIVCIIIFYFYIQSRTNKMTSSGSTQCQASYSPIILEKPSLEFLIQSIKLATDETEAAKLMQQLADYMRSAEGQLFEYCLMGLNYLFKKGYTSVFMTYVDLMRKMMNHFTRLGRQLQDDAQDQNTEFRMLYVLSVIAELIRENPKFYFPFTRKFLLTVFRIDYELLQKSTRRNDILAILSVIYENFSRQGRLVNKYQMINTLKTSLLQNYSLIAELFTMKVFNRAICNLTAKGVVFSTQEFTKYKILETLGQFIEKSQIQLFTVKLKMAMVMLGKGSQENKAMCI